MSFFEDKSQGAIDSAIRRAKEFGLSSVSDEQLRRIKEAAQQAGSVGDAARDALKR